MTSKDQERATLARIRKLVDDLGENSYLGSAFDGAFRLAENNIEDDAAYTTKFYIDECHKLQAMQRESIDPEQLARLQSEIAGWKQDHDQLQRRNEYLEGLVEKFEASNKTLGDRNIELASRLDDTRKEADRRDVEIMTLKAKLYDLMTATA